MNYNFFLKIYAVTLTLILASLIYYIKAFKRSITLDELTVERINIIEPDGLLKMVISNSERQHSGMFDGQIINQRERPPGIIFFNEEQDEVGGLIYEGNKAQGAGMVLSFDQYKNDQILQMQYQRNSIGNQKYGINVWDRSEEITLPKLLQTYQELKKRGVKDSYNKALDSLRKINDGQPISAERLFAGKTYSNQVGLFIKDNLGNDRIRILVDENNVPIFHILDDKGNVINDLILTK